MNALFLYPVSPVELYTNGFNFEESIVYMLYDML